MGAHLGLDDDPALVGPTPGPAGEFAIAAGRCVPGFDIGPHLCHQRLGKALQFRVLRHAHHILESPRLEKREQLRAGKTPIQAYPQPRPGKRPAQTGQHSLQHTNTASLGRRVARAQDVAEQLLLHLIVKGQESGQRQITRDVVEAIEERQLLGAMGRIERRIQVDGDPPNPLLAPSVAGNHRLRQRFGQASAIPAFARQACKRCRCPANRRWRLTDRVCIFSRTCTASSRLIRGYVPMKVQTGRFNAG